MDDLSARFVNATGPVKEEIAKLMTEGYKVALKIEKLLIAERVQQPRKIKKLLEEIAFDMALFLHHKEQLN